MIDDFIADQWSGLYQRREEMNVSPYTMTKDSMFILDTLPTHPGIAIFSAGNGRCVLRRIPAFALQSDFPSE